MFYKTLSPFIPALQPITVSRFTVFSVLLLAILKIFSYAHSGANVVLSSLLDSLSDMGLSVMTLVALHWSSKPKDDNHRFGHGKIEGVSALLQAAFMMGAASFLVLESFNRFLKPQPITDHILTLFIFTLVLLATFLITTLQKKSLEVHSTLALKADNAHYNSDIYLNLTVIAVVGIDFLGLAPQWLDPLVGLCVSAFFAFTAYKIAIDAINLLMDKEIEGEIRTKIIETIKTHPEILCFHDLRVTGTEKQLLISLDIEVKEHLTIKQAHEIARALEHNLLEHFPLAQIFIHIDPEGDTHDSRH